MQQGIKQPQVANSNLKKGRLSDSLEMQERVSSSNVANHSVWPTIPVRNARPHLEYITIGITPPPPPSRTHHPMVTFHFHQDAARDMVTYLQIALHSGNCSELATRNKSSSSDNRPLEVVIVIARRIFGLSSWTQHFCYTTAVTTLCTWNVNEPILRDSCYGFAKLITTPDG